MVGTLERVERVREEESKVDAEMKLIVELWLEVQRYLVSRTKLDNTRQDKELLVGSGGSGLWHL